MAGIESYLYSDYSYEGLGAPAQWSFGRVPYYPTLPIRTSRGRHIRYRPAGALPIAGELPDAICMDNFALSPDFLAVRHLDYTAAGLARAAFAYICCDAGCSQAEVDAGVCWKEPACFPYGEGPGIAYKVRVYMFEVKNCFSARARWADLYYSAVTRHWHGTIQGGMRGGSLDLEWWPLCNDTFLLKWSGCDNGFFVQPWDCQDPLVVIYPNIQLPGCCDCPVAGYPATEEAPEVTFYLHTNCRRFVSARHLDYADGTRAAALMTPIVGKHSPCAYSQGGNCTACNVTCPLVMTISDGGPFNGTFPLAYGAPNCGVGEWCNLGVGPGEFHLSCADLGGGFVRLTLSGKCAVTNTGLGTIDLPYCLADGVTPTMENLDVTITMTWVDPDPSEACFVGTLHARIMRL